MKEQSDPGNIDACELRTDCGINAESGWHFQDLFIKEQ